MVDNEPKKGQKPKQPPEERKNETGKIIRIDESKKEGEAGMRVSNPPPPKQETEKSDASKKDVDV